MRPPTALTIAGSDPAGGAGIQGDLRAFAALGVHGLSAITSVIAQATRGVRATWPLEPAQVRAQLEAVLEDVPVDAAKTGALGTAAIVEVVAEVLEARTEAPLVVDPVLASSSGAALLDGAGLRAVVERLMPRATLITPNAPELAMLLFEPAPPVDVDALVRAAERLRARGARAVLAKGGHLAGDPIDVLVDARGVRTFEGTRIETPCTRGTGCTLSAAIAAELAKGGELDEAVVAARSLLRAAMERAAPIGPGASPLEPIALARRS